jgi:hypothetical protein
MSAVLLLTGEEDIDVWLTTWNDEYAAWTKNSERLDSNDCLVDMTLRSLFQEDRLKRLWVIIPLLNKLVG